MRNDQYIKPGTLFFALAILAIGISHIVTGNFPAGLMPVPMSVPGRMMLVSLTGGLLVGSGILLLVKKYAFYGTVLAGLVFLVILLIFHLPRLARNLYDPGAWTPTVEILALFSGTLLMMDITSTSNEVKMRRRIWLVAGRDILAVSLIVFGVQHYEFAGFIAGLVPSWIPWPLFWVYLVMVGFFATAISLLINQLVRLSATLMAFMFFIWILILHLPRAMADPRAETEWTSLFISLAMCGISLLVAGAAGYKEVKNHEVLP